MSIKRNKFFEFFMFVCFLIALFRKFSKLLYDAVYSSFLLIHVFSKANDVSIELKSEKYENNQIKITLIVLHISINFSFQWIFALFNINIERKLFNETDVQKKILIFDEIVENDCDDVIVMHFSSDVIFNNENK